MSRKRPAQQRKAAKVGRKEVKRGRRPTYHLALAKAEVAELPWLEFGGNKPAEIAEAARRAVAGELGVRPDEVEIRVTLSRPSGMIDG